MFRVSILAVLLILGVWGCVSGPPLPESYYAAQREQARFQQEQLDRVFGVRVDARLAPSPWYFVYGDDECP